MAVKPWNLEDVTIEMTENKVDPFLAICISKNFHPFTFTNTCFAMFFIFCQINLLSMVIMYQPICVDIH